MKGYDKILKLRLVQLPYFNMLIVKCKMLTEAPRLKLVLFSILPRCAASGLGSGEDRVRTQYPDCTLLLQLQGCYQF